MLPSALLESTSARKVEVLSLWSQCCEEVLKMRRKTYGIKNSFAISLECKTRNKQCQNIFRSDL